MRRIGQGAEYADMPQRKQHFAHIGNFHAFQHKVYQLDVATDVGKTVHFRPCLQGFAHIRQTVGLRVQHRTGITQPVNPLVGGQKMGIDTRHLRRDVGAYAQLPAAEPVRYQNGFQ